MKELIEKLEHAIMNHQYDTEDRGLCCVIDIKTIVDIIQALTSVKSEQQVLLITEENVKNAYNATLDKLRLVKSESAEGCLKKYVCKERILDSTELMDDNQYWEWWNKMYSNEHKDQIYQAMHNFANEDKKQHAIGFVKYCDSNPIENMNKKYNELYTEYLNTLNRKESSNDIS